jgi:hypothetical protein
MHFGGIRILVWRFVLVFLGLFTVRSHEAKVNWASNKVAVK